MNQLWILLLLLVLGVAALVSYLVRLNRKSKEIEKSLDYSKMRKWEDED